MDKKNDLIELEITNEALSKYLPIDPMTTIFNLNSWWKVLTKAYNFNINFVTLNSECLAAGIPFRIQITNRHKIYTSLPFSDEVPFVGIISDNDKIIDEIIKNNIDTTIELRCKYNSEIFENKLIGYKHLLNLNKNEEELLNSFHKSLVIRNIKKARSNNLAIRISSSINDLNEFYNLHLLTRRKLGVPIQPKNFFRYFFEEIIQNGFGFLTVIEKEKIPIAMGIFAGININITYKFGASNPKYLSCRPNHLMFWTAIQEAKKRGFEVFDFGRTELGNEGLRKFKQGWGTIEQPLFYSYYPKAPANYKLKFIKDKIITPLIKYSPKFVCRLSGELLYKYFG